MTKSGSKWKSGFNDIWVIKALQSLNLSIESITFIIRGYDFETEIVALLVPNVKCRLLCARC